MDYQDGSSLCARVSPGEVGGNFTQFLKVLIFSFLECATHVFIPFPMDFWVFFVVVVVNAVTPETDVDRGDRMTEFSDFLHWR